LSKAKQSPVPEPERRDFLRVAVYGGIVAGAAGLGLIAQFPVEVAASGAATLPLIPLSSLGTLETGKPMPLEVSLARRDGWRVRTLARRVYLTRKGEGDKAESFTAFSAVCPHAGCEVGMGDKEYVCPCHNAKFDAEGAVKSGPAPRGLDALQLSVAEREGAPWLFVAWQEFVVGIKDRTPRTT
jgi:Rieske Fe-S protein